MIFHAHTASVQQGEQCVCVYDKYAEGHAPEVLLMR